MFWVLVLMTDIFNVEPGEVSLILSRWWLVGADCTNKNAHIYQYIYIYIDPFTFLFLFFYIFSASCLLSKYEFVDSWYSTWLNIFAKVAKDNLQMYDLVRSHTKDLQQIKSHKSLCRIHIFVCSISWYCNDGNIQGSLSSLVVQVVHIVVMILVVYWPSCKPSQGGNQCFCCLVLPPPANKSHTDIRFRDVILTFAAIFVARI